MRPINVNSACKAHREKYAALERWRSTSSNSYLSELTKARIEKEKNDALAAYDAAIGSETKLAQILEDVQRRSKVRTIDVAAIIDSLVEIEDELDISKKAMEGITVHVDRNAQDFPSAYKYVPESTHFEAVYKNGSWRVTKVSRDVTLRARQRITITHTEESKAALLARFTRWG